MFFASYVIKQSLFTKITVLKRHCNTHKEKYDLFVGKIREDKLNELKSCLNEQ
jgi:hypothetical protein